jgi:hypothetical protein
MSENDQMDEKNTVQPYSNIIQPLKEIVLLHDTA